jgi:hypothetical protein
MFKLAKLQDYSCSERIAVSDETVANLRWMSAEQFN